MGLRGWLFKETFLSYISGAVFAAGWWIWIDACVYASISHDPKKIYVQYYIPGIVSTVAVFLCELVRFYEGFWAESQNTKAKIWFFASFTIAFGALLAALWIGIQHWLVDDAGSQYPGIAIILQNGLIFFAALIYRFAKPQVDEFGEPLLANS